MHIRLELTLFGSPTVHLGGKSVAGFRSSKTQALLYYLAVTGRPHSRPTLAGLLWGDQPESAARVSLSKCLSNLYEIVGDALLIERQSVAFNREFSYQLDTERFNEAMGAAVVTSASAQAAQQALSLYRGDFLEGFYVRDASDFEHWQLGQRALFRESVTQGLHGLAQFAEEQRDLPAAVNYTRRLLALEPWREEAHRRLMLLLAHSGQRAAALAQFEVCCRVLDEELGARPDEETMALTEAIRSGTIDKMTARHGDRSLPISISQPLNHPVTHTLPIPPTPLIDREQELAELGELLGDPDCRLVTITGPGGIGKTRLSLAVAAEQERRFSQGAFFVPLAAVSVAQFLPQAILAALKAPVQSDLSPAEQLRLLLCQQECLLVLDNYEHLLPEIDLVVEILNYAPKVTVLVTSRERLALQAEHLRELTGLDYPPVQSTQTGTSALPWTSYAAVRLFLQRVRQTQPRFTPNERESAAIASICRLTEGLPLALEMAAAMLREQTCTELAQALDEGQAALTSTLRDLPERHRSIPAVFEHSWRLLSKAEQAILRAISVFQGGYLAEAAQTVAGATPMLLAALVDKSLLRRSEAGRYDMHELVRQYGRGKLVEAGLEPAVRRLHLHYFLGVATQHEPNITGPPQADSLDALEHDHANFRAALAWGFAQTCTAPPDGLTAAWLAARLGRFWYVQQHWTEGREWLAKALGWLETAEEEDSSVPTEESRRALRARLLYRLGAMASIETDYGVAQPALEESLLFYQQIDDLRSVVRCLQELAAIANAQGDYTRSAQRIHESLDYSRRLGDDWLIGISLQHLADLTMEQGDHQRSAEFAREGVEIFRQLNDLGPLSSCLNLLAQAAIASQNYAQAVALLEDSLAVNLKRNQQSKGGPWTLRNLGLATQMLGAYEQSAEYYRRSLLIRYEKNQIGGVAWALEGLGEVLSLTNHPLRAACVWGIAAALRQRDGSVMSASDRQRYEAILASTRAQLPPAVFAAAWSKGANMSLAQTVAYALDDGESVVS